MKKKIKLIDPCIFLSESVAIIGNSSSILRKKLGRVIDSHDDVVRFNRAKTKSFEDYVGTRTTLRVINNPTFECASIKPGHGWEESDNDVDFAFTLKNINIITISPHIIKKDLKIKYSKKENKYFFLEKKFLQFIVCIYFSKNLSIFFNLVSILLQRKNFSIGLYTILLCIISGIKPNLYGFDLSENMKLRSHYWEKAGKVGKYHDLSKEHNIIKKLLELNFVKLHI